MPATRQARDELIERHLPLAERLARRYAHTTEPFDDLVQVAREGLLKAATRWDPGRGTPFGAYAVPTMTGELRRYFRDRAWAVRPPRGLQELWLDVERARERLLQELGREPSARDVASRLGRDVEQVLAALEAGRAYAAQSLDAPLSLDEPDGDLAEALVVDPCDELDRSEDTTVIAQLCANLCPRDREVVRLRYEDDLFQHEIAERLGCSQMQVSRRLREALGQLQVLAGVR